MDSQKSEFSPYSLMRVLVAKLPFLWTRKIPKTTIGGRAQN
ncbi:hypothetical protein P1059_01948 [Pasteurella multocida subsp. gallicida P1059]|nr:hypothetical protein P1059_01948 [Pasteurella multocida subsp. gallicida P1059]